MESLYTKATNSLFTIQMGMEASGGTGSFAQYLKSIWKCEQKCAERPTCNIYTYNKLIGSGACYLYTRADLKPNAAFDKSEESRVDKTGNTESSARPINPLITTAPNSLFTIQRGMEA